MAESFSVKAILSAKDSGFSSTLKGASSAVETLSSKVKSGIGFGILTGIGQQAFSALTSGARDLAGEINSSTKAWKTYEGNMKILGKGEKEINSVKKTLQDYAEVTVYSSSDMASSYAQLAAVGIKSADKLVTGFGGLAGAAENPAQAMKTLSQQGVQMAAKPTVAWQDFKLMLEQTPAGIAAVAKEMGMSTSEMVTAVQDGEISTNAFFKAVEKVGNSKGFSKLATEYKTVDQAADGLKETVGNKLMPAFEVLNQKGIKALSGLADKIGEIDADKAAKTVSNLFDRIESGISKAKPYVTALKEAFSGVGAALGEAFKAVRDSLGELNGEFGSTKSVDTFKSAMLNVANAIKTVAGFITEHSDSIAKLIKLLPGVVIGIKAFSIAKSVAPGIALFTKGIAGLAGKGISGIASKLFGISGAQDAVGKSSSVSGKKMLTSAKSFALMGVGVLAVAAGFALLAFSAISLANAGGGAIAVMAGLVVALAALGVGMAVLGKSLAPMSKKLMPVATAMLAMGAAVLLISAGFALLAMTSIQLANAGGAAIGVMVGMVAAIALLAVGAAALGTALTAGAVGFVAFGAAVLMVGAGFALIGVSALLAANALKIIASVLPQIAASGLKSSLAITALGGALTVFAVGAGLAGAACIALGAGLLLIGTAVLLAGAGMLMLGTGTLLAASALRMVATILPVLAANGTSGAAAIALLGASMAAFAVGAGLAGAAAIVFGAGLAVVSIAIIALTVGIVALAAGIAVLAIGVAAAAASMALAAGGLALLNLALPATIANGAAASVAMLALSAGLLALGAAALVAGAGFVVLGAGLTVAGAGIIVFGAALLTASVGTLAMSVALVAVNSSMKSISSNAKSAASSLKSMNNSVSVVKSGLDAIGDKAKSAMNKLTSAFDNTASKAQSSGKKVGTGFANGVQNGMKSAVSVSKSGTKQVTSSLRAGYSGAYSAGAYISIGFADGMRSQLSAIQSAANKMVSAANKAIQAKAKIHSPSKVTEKLGEYYGEGYVMGISDMFRQAWRAAEQLVSIPQVTVPAFAGNYSGELSADYEYNRDVHYTIQVPLNIDGREFAKAEVGYLQDELNIKQKREERKRGKV